MKNRRSNLIARVELPEPLTHNIARITHLEVRVAWDEGGANYFSGGTERKGFEVSAHGVEVKDGFVSFLVGGGLGGRLTLESATRFNAKRLQYWTDLVTPRIEAAMPYVIARDMRSAVRVLAGVPLVTEEPAPAESVTA